MFRPSIGIIEIFEIALNCYLLQEVSALFESSYFFITRRICDYTSVPRILCNTVKLSPTRCKEWDENDLNKLTVCKVGIFF